MKKTVYEKSIRGIVNQMTQIIGPVAIMQANTLKGLRVTALGDVDIKGDAVDKIKKLIKAYEVLIGPVAATIAKKGIQKILEKNPKLKIPEEWG